MSVLKLVSNSIALQTWISLVNTSSLVKMLHEHSAYDYAATMRDSNIFELK